MTKREWILEAAKAAKDKGRELHQADMNVALQALCDVAAADLLGGGEIALPGLGKLKSKKMAARKGHNPRTGELIDIPSHRKVVFIAGKELKDALKG